MATSSLCFSVAAALALLAAASPQDALDASLIHSKCQTFLTDVSVRGHSKFELSAVCRSRFPSDVCSSSLSLLGSTPWAPTTISATCDKWQAEYAKRTQGLSPSRLADTRGSVMDALDQATKAKAQMGLCVNKTLDECCRYKAKEYPKASQKILDTLNALYAGHGKPGHGKQGHSIPARKYQAHEVDALSGHTRGFWAGAALLSASTAAAAAMLVVRLRRGPAASAVLVEHAEDGEEALGE
mmetsp:Transcript_59622/g.169628  ORF Transcript_59622/g.169628 Transcript_59622/m.169628 type:complete len:241 (-) Transcript_59622:101-823(-)